jgi:tetratricopeptide (TPR) repeat protein
MTTHDLTVSTSPRPRRQRRLAWAIAGIVVLLVAGSMLRAWLAPVPEIPVPPDPAKLEPQLRAYIADHVRSVLQAPRNPQRRATLGLVYAANGLWAEAKRTFQTVVALQPREPLAHMYYAVACQELGQRDEALRLFQQLTAQFPQFAPGYYRLGEALLGAGDAGHAAAAFRRLTELAPQEWRGYAGLGDALLRQGDLTNAVKSLEQAVHMDASAQPAHYLLGQAYQRIGRTNEAPRELKLGLNAQHYPMPDAWSVQAPQHMKRVQDEVDMAQQYVKAGYPDRAIPILETALRYNTNSLPLLHNLAFAYERAGQPQKALPLVERTLQIDPRYVSGYVLLSAVWLALGRNDAALTNADHAAKLAPNTVQPHLARANALLALERDAEAVTALDTAAACDPRNPQIHTDLGDILYQNLNRPDAALGEYQKAAAIDPLFLPAQLRLAELQWQLGRTNEAVAALRTARQIAPQDERVAVLDRRLGAAPPP